MQIVVVGLNQNSAPVAARERVAFAPSGLSRGLAALREYVAEGFILSTCNRVEVYGVAGHADSGTQLLKRFLTETRGVTTEELFPFLYSYGHEAAVAHLFRVASGMDSMVVGEGEVLTQVRAAVGAAHAAGTLGPVMRRLGSAAVGAGKRVRAHTEIARNPLSVVTLALRAAALHGHPVAGASILVLGAGATAETVLRHLAAASPRRVTVLSRRQDRAATLAARFGFASIGTNDLADALAVADIVGGCTSAPEFVLNACDVDAARSGMKRLLCLDLGVPRDIDPEVRNVPGVTVVDLDELQAAADENRARRAGEVERGEVIVAREVERFMEWWRSRQVIPTIAALRAHAAEIRDAEVAHALARLGDPSSRDALVVQALAQRIVGKLLHRPLTVLRTEAEGANMAHVLRQLFQLELEAERPACRAEAGTD